MDHDELVTLTRQIVRGRARRYGLDHDVVDDLVQNVLVKYLKAWPGPQGPDNPGAWVQHAANNAAIDHLRRNQRQPADQFAPGGDDPLALLMATLRTVGTPSNQIVGDAVWQDALALLSEPDADLLRRRYIDAVPAADLAAEQGVSRAVIDQRTARAKKQMRAALAKRPDLVTALQSKHQHGYLSDHRFR
jgi:RNA polymerase sigma factor (sigma-70 family)